MPWFSERRALALLAQAYEGGVRAFDTAGFYADGEAERRLGRALKSFTDEVFVTTKTGTCYRGVKRPIKDFSSAAIEADLEASLRRLGRERVDVLYLHGPSREALYAARETLSRLKEQGKIARWGVCGEGAGLEEALEAGAEALMGVFNFLRREHEDMFARARAQGAHVVAIAPLAQGLYDRNFFRASSPADAWRIARALLKNRGELRRARASAPVLEAVEGFTPAQAALGFALSNPAIDIAMTTTTRPAHLAEILAAPGSLPPRALEALRSLP